MVRAIDTRTGIRSDVLVKSSGRYSMVSAMGLFQGGEYLSKKQIEDGLRSHTTANTTGLVLMKAESEGTNISEYGKTVTAGNMSLAEEVDFTGGRDD